VENGDQKKIIKENDPEARGSHFNIGDNYVDYTSPQTGESLNEITQELLEGEFLVLERTVNMQKTKA